MLVINVKRGASYELNSDFILSRDKIPWNNLIQLTIKSSQNYRYDQVVGIVPGTLGD